MKKHNTNSDINVRILNRIRQLPEPTAYAIDHNIDRYKNTGTFKAKI